MIVQPGKKCIAVFADLRRFTAAFQKPPARYARGYFELPKNSVLGPTSESLFCAVDSLHHIVRARTQTVIKNRAIWRPKGCVLHFALSALRPLSPRSRLRPPPSPSVPWLA